MSKRTKELLRENNAWEKENLSAENQHLMTNIVTYIRSAAISEYEQELVRRDVMAMLAAGEREGRSAEKVIGDDAQAFCDEVIAALPPRSAGERAVDALRTGLLAFVVLAVCWLGAGAVEMIPSGSWPYFPITVGDVISQALIFLTAFLIFRSISRHAFDDKMGKLFFLVFAALAISILSSIFLTQFLCNVHILVFAVLLAVCFIGYKFLDARVD